MASSLVTPPQVSVTKQRKLPPTPEMERTPTVGEVALETSNAGVPSVLVLMPSLSAAPAVPGPAGCHCHWYAGVVPKAAMENVAMPLGHVAAVAGCDVTLSSVQFRGRTIAKTVPKPLLPPLQFVPYRVLPERVSPARGSRSFVPLNDTRVVSACAKPLDAPAPTARPHTIETMDLNVLIVR